MILRNADLLFNSRNPNIEFKDTPVIKTIYYLSRNNTSKSNESELLKHSDQIPPMPKIAARLKAACICIISGIMYHCPDIIINSLDKREINLINYILQLTSMMSLHSRCIIFLNNLYLYEKFRDLIASIIIPSLSTLIMYYLTNHMKLYRYQLNSASQEEIEFDKNQKLIHGEVDKMYNDDLYNDFISSACEFLANMTSGTKEFEFNELDIITDIILTLFLKYDELEEDALVSVIRCVANLSNIEECRAKFSNVNVSQVCINIMERFQQEKIKAYLFLFIGNMSDSEEFCNNILNFSDIIELLLDFITTTDGEYLEYSVLSLANISVKEASIPFIVDMLGIEIMTELCYSESAFIRRQATRVLYSISRYENGILCQEMRLYDVEKALKYVLNKSSDAQEIYSNSKVVDLALCTLVLVQTFGDENQYLENDLDPCNLVSNENKKKAEELKDLGNEQFVSKKWNEAINNYTEALNLDPYNVVIYSNRSAAYIQLKQYDLALYDAEKCISLAPKWVKGYFRKGKALCGLNEFAESIVVMEKALALNDNNEIRNALKKAYELKNEHDEIILKNIESFNFVDIISTLETYSVIYFEKIMSQLKILCESPNESFTNVNPNLLIQRYKKYAFNVNLSRLMKIKAHEDIFLKQSLVNEGEKFDVVSDPLRNLYDIIIIIILSRLVNEFPEFRIKSMKRLLNLSSIKQVRNTLGEHLFELFLFGSTITNEKSEIYRKLFLGLGGVKFIVLECNENEKLRDACLKFLEDISFEEWKKLPSSEIEFILGTLVFSPASSKDDRISSIIGKLFSLPCVLNNSNTTNYIKAFDDNDFRQFIEQEIQGHGIDDIEIDLTDSETLYQQLGYEIGKKWIRVKGIPSLEDKDVIDD